MSTYLRYDIVQCQERVQTVYLKRTWSDGVLLKNFETSVLNSKDRAVIARVAEDWCNV